MLLVSAEKKNTYCVNVERVKLNIIERCISLSLTY